MQEELKKEKKRLGLGRESTGEEEIAAIEVEKSIIKVDLSTVPTPQPATKPLQSIQEIKQQLFNRIQAAAKIEELQVILKELGFYPLPESEKHQILDAYQNKYSLILSELKFGKPIKIEEKPRVLGAPTPQELWEAELKKRKEEIKTKLFVSIQRKFSAFNIDIPIITKKVISSMVPSLTIKQFYGFKIRKNFNSELSKIIVPLKTILVPKFQVKTFLEAEVKEKVFNSDIPQELIFRQKETEKEIVATTEAKGGLVEKEFEAINFFELLFGKGWGRISDGKPVCIIVEKTKAKLEKLIAVLCRDIYREKVGGKPTPINRVTIENLRRDVSSLVERKIIVIENIDVEESREELFEMLKGFFSQDLGFLILVTSEFLKLENEIRNVEPSANIVTIFGLPPEIERKEKEILRTVRGKKSVALAMSFDATGSVSIEEIRGFGEEFKTSVENFDGELEKYREYKKAPRELKRNWDKLMACSPTDYEKKASNEHSAMKAFVWLYEWIRHDKRKIPDLETPDTGADVRIDGNNYEIETLFGIGDITGKLTEKMKKYEKYKKYMKVYFVMRNLDILRNLPILSTFRTNWRKEGYEVEFFGLDFDKADLIPLEDFHKILKF